MGIRRDQAIRLSVALLLLVALLALMTACGSDDPQNTFAAEGDVARKQRDLLIYWVLGPATVILIGVQAALIYALVRYRRKKGEGPPTQVHGNTSLEVAWTIAPAILLLVIAVPTVIGIVDLASEPGDDALQVDVIGQQFSWEFQYPEITDAEGNPLTVIGLPGQPAELHIPVGRDVHATLHSRDVIHSFWVPRLAGKLDAVPGRNNRMWFNATRPGSYSGQCAEFCGLQHADMRLRVVAESEEDFQAWVTDRLEGGAAAGAGPGDETLVLNGE